MSDTTKKSIPAWQKQGATNTDSATTDSNATEPSTTSSHAELLEQARIFLNEESIRSAPRERKVAFLREKGIKLEDIQKLLNIETNQEEEKNEELRTVHDTSTSATNVEEAQTSPQTLTPTPNDTHTANQFPPRDVPPIITYPEFLLKPQKPPPLVTFDRLVNAVYAFAAVSALTYGASKYIVEPMLETLSTARHDLADITLQDLEKLNHKLETSVSHIPYIASKPLSKPQQDHDSDTESITSDPTELFHRDIATQTTPTLSRSSSQTSQPNHNSPFNITNTQTSKLSSLTSTLKDLLASTDPSTEPFSPTQPSKHLQETISQFQIVLDKLENTYNPFRTDYSNIYSSSSSSLDASKNNNKLDSNEAAKFKAEIRNLKGAFLSSRNFPTARPATPGGYRAR